MVSAWYMTDDRGLDQRLKHQPKPSRSVPINRLKDLGVDYWYFDPEFFRSDYLYEKLIQDRNFTYEDQVELSPSLTENYLDKIKSFYDEHLHTDDEIRYILAGSGYFDVRDLNDNWIRIEVSRGDMICLPAGIFHRFTTDTKNYIKALRLFAGEPVWTPIPRSKINGVHPSVVQYRRKFASTGPTTSSQPHQQAHPSLQQPHYQPYGQQPQPPQPHPDQLQPQHQPAAHPSMVQQHPQSSHQYQPLLQPQPRQPLQQAQQQQQHLHPQQHMHPQQQQQQQMQLQQPQMHPQHQQHQIRQQHIQQLMQQPMPQQHMPHPIPHPIPQPMTQQQHQQMQQQQQLHHHHHHHHQQQQQQQHPHQQLHPQRQQQQPHQPIQQHQHQHPHHQPPPSS